MSMEPLELPTPEAAVAEVGGQQAAQAVLES
jgi:hypothetical protein